MSSTIDRLLSLPEVFTLADMARLGLKGQAAHTFLLRARDAKRIAQVGVRAGAYYNLIKDQLGPVNRKLDAVRKLYPSAVLGGAAVLHAAGWVTQIPQRYLVMVLARPSVKIIDGVDLLLRNERWYRLQSELGNIVNERDSSFGITTLTPRAALEDARKYQDSWMPDEDDLDIDEDEEAKLPAQKVSMQVG